MIFLRFGFTMGIRTVLKERNRKIIRVLQGCVVFIEQYFRNVLINKNNPKTCDSIRNFIIFLIS